MEPTNGTPAEKLPPSPSGPSADDGSVERALEEFIALANTPRARGSQPSESVRLRLPRQSSGRRRSRSPYPLVAVAFAAGAGAALLGFQLGKLGHLGAGLAPAQAPAPAETVAASPPVSRAGPPPQVVVAIPAPVVTPLPASEIPNAARSRKPAAAPAASRAATPRGVRRPVFLLLGGRHDDGTGDGDHGDDGWDAADEATLTQAKEHCATASRLYQQGDLRGALEQLKDAYRLTRNPLLLHDIGSIYDQLGDGLAAHYYEKFLAAPAPPSASPGGLDARRRQVRARLSELE
jgi:hypothetical protein